LTFLSEKHDMNNELILKSSVVVHAPVSRAWAVLTNPEFIKEYLFGTQTTSDWIKGSPIEFTGEWEGKAYCDKGIIQDIEPEKLLRYTYWSSFSGTEDVPENYSAITYELEAKDGQTVFSLTQQGFASEEGLRHSEDNWSSILQNIKTIAERS
jgi:uncharacterized protein YndB with AHSA1/START domain